MSRMRPLRARDGVPGARVSSPSEGPPFRETGRAAWTAAQEVGGQLGILAGRTRRGFLDAAAAIGGDLVEVARLTAAGAARAGREVLDDLGRLVAPLARRAVPSSTGSARRSRRRR